MRELWLIGIGTGSPNHITLQARQALCAAALILLPKKGVDKSALAALRRRIIDESGASAPVIEFDYPVRDPDLPYVQAVDRWHGEIARRWQSALAGRRLQGPVALLVWGDPSLYDSSLRIAERLNPKPRIRMLPGISALQALTCAHAIPCNTLGGEVTVTTGRRLRERGWPRDARSVVVMLDGACSFQTLDSADTHIWWGAYLGMDEQLLERGPLAEAAPRILTARAAARARHGWIMDTYLLRRMSGGGGFSSHSARSRTIQEPWA